MSENVEATTPGETHNIVIDPVGLISEIISNIADPRDIIRELISNASAKQVGAKRIEIRIYESDKGLSFTISDDGCGMNYTKNNKAPGRLDRFLNAAQGKQAGFESDEFGAKGLGAKLLYNSEFVEIETWDGGDSCYRIIFDNPRRTILEDKNLVNPTVYTIPADKHPTRKRGTSITVKGWAALQSITKEFKLDQIERYLRYFTVVGYTKPENRDPPLPEFVIRVGALQKVLKAGFPFISSDNKDVRTVTFGPITVEKLMQNGKKIRMSLKGGITVDTGKFQLSDLTGGVWLSVNGIPYFALTVIVQQDCQ